MANALHYAVVVGINDYPEFSPLNFAKSDAESFANWLKKKTGGNVPDQNVTVILSEDGQAANGDRESAIPVRRQVYNALYHRWKAVDQHVEENPEDWEKTRFYFYVSGHGIAPTPNDAALLMADAGPDYLGENISCSGLFSFLKERQCFKEIIFFADCCREKAGNAPIGDVPWTHTQRDFGRVTYAQGYATSFGDFAYEPKADEGDPNLKRGYFTTALLEGLEGKAALDDSGVIDSNSLAKFVRERVKFLTKHLSRQQDPTMDADPSAPIIFSKTHQQVTYKVTIECVSGYRGKARLIGGKAFDAELDVEERIISLHLPDGVYRVIRPEGDPDDNPFENSGYFTIMGGDKHVRI